jgi:hypothetical protein
VVCAFRPGPFDDQPAQMAGGQLKAGGGP